MVFGVLRPKRLSVVQIPAQTLLRVYRPYVVVDHGAATSLSCLYCKSVFFRKTAGGCRAFFARLSSRAKKWVNSRKHKVDFVIQNVNGEELCVEVKGWMSYSSVNELQYLLSYSGHKFYILQVTN
ncbi:MAG: hypothetical protein IJI36_08025, partial [Kiritimatiellae bacterium]|nr:hypothetical protein [Kiritimatiellia bacterium]